MKDLAVFSTGERANYPRYYRQSEKKTAFLQRKLAKKEYGSSNYRELRLRPARMHEHTAEQRLDFLHKLSYRTVKDYDIIGVEDIDLRQMASFRFWKSIGDNGFGKFRVQLCYKTEWRGKKFAVVDRYFPSTQLCSQCGKKNIAMKGLQGLSIREWKCPSCRRVLDRDVNAALNIKEEAVRIYKSNSTSTSGGIDAGGEVSRLQRTRASLDETGKVDVIALADKALA